MGQVKFELGQVVMTREVYHKLKLHQVLDCLKRHAHGDWGDIPKEDVQYNVEALDEGLRIISVYRLNAKQRVRVITEAEDDNCRRSYTTIMFCDEY